jgi:hypothetical protein
MWIRNLAYMVLSLALLSAGAARAMTQEELVAKLEAAGYTKVSDIKSTAEGTSAKAIKDGKEVHLVVDSNGQVKEQP